MTKEANSCYNKKLEKPKKSDPIESSFLSLSAAIQNHLTRQKQTEGKCMPTNQGDALASRTDEALANLIMAELSNLDEQKKASKKAKILKILYEDY